MRNTAITILEPAELDATTTSDAVEVTAWHGMVDFILTATATGGAGQTAVVKIQHSDKSDTGFADAGIEFETVDDEAGSTQIVTANVDQLKHYVRAVVTLDGTTPTVACAVVMSGKRNYA